MTRQFLVSLTSIVGKYIYIYIPWKSMRPEIYTMEVNETRKNKQYTMEVNSIVKSTV